MNSYPFSTVGAGNMLVRMKPIQQKDTDRHIESVEDEDEVLTALGDELGNFVEYVGGPEHGHVLLSPLENLAGIEEPLVRDKVRERVALVGDMWFRMHSD
jgi:hypothetical protein